MNKVLDMRTPVASSGVRTFWSVAVIVVILALFVQAWIVVQARPQDLVTGAHGMADIISRAMPPAFDQFVPNLWPVLETIDLAIFGTVFGVLLAFPLAILAAANVTPAKPLY